MSIFWNKTIEKQSQLGLWRIEENEDFFKSSMPETYYQEGILKYRHAQRRLEWLAGRYLLYKMSDGKRCRVDEYGKPHLVNSSQNVSLSHSGNYAAAVMSKKVVGIDIEQIRPKIKRIAHKFLRPEEKECLDENHFLEHLHVFWGAKEALYKAYGKKELDFRQHILVAPFDFKNNGDLIAGKVIKDDYHGSFLISYQKVNDYILVYAIKE